METGSTVGASSLPYPDAESVAYKNGRIHVAGGGVFLGGSLQLAVHEGFALE